MNNDSKYLKVYLSYSWSPTSTKVADEIEEKLSSRGFIITVVRLISFVDGKPVFDLLSINSEAFP